MLAFITKLVAQIAMIRWLFKLGGLVLLLPIAAMLKAIGLPVLIVLLVIGAPILILLFLFGLPIFAVLAVGSLLIGFVAMLLMLGVAALKFALFVVLPIWLIWKLGCWAWRGMSRRDGGDTPPSTTEPVDPIDPGTPPNFGTDPAM
ncbi:MAG TPA: hypothetical protein VGM50_22010 [Gemmatimonadaceae bacterium]|jgi:hypothetical protein